MKICFISHSSGAYGAERSLMELIDCMNERGIMLHVMLPSQGPLAEELQRRGIPFSIIPYKWWVSTRTSPLWKRIGRAILNLVMVVPTAVIIKRSKADIIYSNTIVTFTGALAARLVHKPHVYNIREFVSEDHGLTFDFGARLSLWLVDKMSSVIITNSQAIADRYKQYISPSKFKVVYQQVNIPTHYLMDTVYNYNNINSAIKCIIVGSLNPGKGHIDAIKAINKLMQDGIKVQLLILGDGDPEYKNYLSRLVNEYGLDDHVKFLGFLENPFPVLQSADVLLMCSRSEAFGRVTVEAMKVGKPVIGTKSGGTVELIKGGFNGFLYTPGDYAELARYIKYLYEHPDEAKAMGENAKRWSTEQFNKERFCGGILAVLNELIR